MTSEETWIDLSDFVGSMGGKVFQLSGVNQQVSVKVFQVGHFFKVQMSQFLEIPESLFFEISDHWKISGVERFQVRVVAQVTSSEFCKVRNSRDSKITVVLEPGLEVSWNHFHLDVSDDNSRDFIACFARDVITRHCVHNEV